MCPSSSNKLSLMTSGLEMSFPSSLAAEAKSCRLVRVVFGESHHFSQSSRADMFESFLGGFCLPLMFSSSLCCILSHSTLCITTRFEPVSSAFKNYNRFLIEGIIGILRNFGFSHFCNCCTTRYFQTGLN